LGETPIQEHHRGSSEVRERLVAIKKGFGNLKDPVSLGAKQGALFHKPVHFAGGYPQALAYIGNGKPQLRGCLGHMPRVPWLARAHQREAAGHSSDNVTNK
jgi:hypothetical protein